LIKTAGSCPSKKLANKVTINVRAHCKLKA
jgi:hypothetical protein